MEIPQRASFAHVDHIMVADFDIDKGASLTHQYPTKTGTHENILAELMLPDGAHLRDEDWTMFFINQPTPSDSVCFPGRKPLMYVLNLVRTKHIAGARRGAQIKAMAVASRHQWVHVFKPLLIMALEAFFNSPTEDIIAELFTSINNMDLSPMPRLSLIERMIIRNSEDRTLFEEKFNEAEERTRTLSLPRSQRSDRADKKPEGGDFILNRMKSIKKKNPGSHSLQANIGTIERTKQKSKFNKDLLYFEARVDFHGVRVPIRVPLAALPEEIGDFSTAKFVSTLLASGIMIPPVNDQTQYQNGVPYYWHPHLDCGSATHGLIVLLNALLTEKRVLFMGYQRPAGDVANYVLAACALISGGGSLLKGISGRCFPYIGLAGLDTLLSVPGYIAGVTNPMFEEQTGWWDVLCDINTGKIKVSPKLEILSGEREPPTLPKDVEWFKAGAWEGDADFIKEVCLIAIHEVRSWLPSNLASEAALAADYSLIPSHMGEMYIRQRFYDRIRRILDVAATVERDLSEDGTTEIGLNKRDLRGSTATEGLSVGFGTYFVDDYAKKREVMMLKNTIEGWRKTTSYQRFKKVGMVARR
ncbi:stabilization of polarity axis-domain-containing protein [Polychytrium aggregatum]|uniref:stabilization of polarity axis-domain-containing protein n=1 Tax=Polychytrium aggregatum TaxID=110093 RepID=UPI0022FE7F19|nr:stabilization of polarity axis-domain-containing protein [Polychytrium aggregatum]KAI9203833.1 stabilization of polarity axis-domain-containing protein [Polychytrium aggregatum]